MDLRRTLARLGALASGWVRDLRAGFGGAGCGCGDGATAEGPESVAGDLLDGLSGDCLAVCDVASPHGRIDHVLITPDRGVFLVEARAVEGRVTTDGGGHLLIDGAAPEEDHVAQSLKNSYWMKGVLWGIVREEVWVTPVLVFTEASVERMPRLKGVSVTDRRSLRHVIERAPAANSAKLIWERREAIAGALRRGA